MAYLLYLMMNGPKQPEGDSQRDPLYHHSSGTIENAPDGRSLMGCLRGRNGLIDLSEVVIPRRRGEPFQFLGTMRSSGEQIRFELQLCSDPSEGWRGTYSGPLTGSGIARGHLFDAAKRFLEEPAPASRSSRPPPTTRCAVLPDTPQPVSIW